MSAPHSLVLLFGTLGVYLLALFGIAAFGLLISTVTRNSAAAVVSTLMFALMMQLIGALPGTQTIRPYLLSNQFTAWHGFLRVPVDWAPIGHAIWLSALYIIVPLSPPTSSSSVGTSQATERRIVVAAGATVQVSVSWSPPESASKSLALPCLCPSIARPLLTVRGAPRAALDGDGSRSCSESPVWRPVRV